MNCWTGALISACTYSQHFSSLYGFARGFGFPMTIMLVTAYSEGKWLTLFESRSFNGLLYETVTGQVRLPPGNSGKRTITKCLYFRAKYLDNGKGFDGVRPNKTM